MVTGDEILNKPELGLLPTVAWQKFGQKPVFALDGGVYTASAAINWAHSLGLFGDFQEINTFDTPPAIDSGAGVCAGLVWAWLPLLGFASPRRLGWPLAKP